VRVHFACFAVHVHTGSLRAEHCTQDPPRLSLHFTAQHFTSLHCTVLYCACKAHKARFHDVTVQMLHAAPASATRLPPTCPSSIAIGMHATHMHSCSCSFMLVLM
jgi:hypothetical protein